MAQTCPRCQRRNPQEAVFCYFDGVYLQQPAGTGAALAVGQMSQDFVFPSGRRCHTFDDLLAGCQQEWEEARELLRRGELGRHLQRVGRMDLASAAQDARTQPDPDIALYNFLALLPAQQIQGPRLDLRPRRISLGPFRPGELRQAGLAVSNLGSGTLQGKVLVSDGWQWLKLVVPARAGGRDQAGEASERQAPIKTSRDQNIGLRIDTGSLVAGQTYSGKLTVITNGGIAEVPIKLTLAIAPFPHAPFQGARNPRELAERMLRAPRQAVPLLESGEVARWFTSNGWAYPVVGAPARDIAAVQQLFECLGLSRPPALILSDQEVVLRSHGETVRGQVVLRTTSKKWVYAQVESENPWLRVTTPAVSGPQQASIAFEADPSAMNGRHGRTGLVEGALRIRANAGQQLAVRVKVALPPRPAGPGWGRLRPLLAGLVLGLALRLLLVVPADLLASLAGSSATDPAPGSLAFWALAPSLEGGFLRRFAGFTWWVGGVVGGWLVLRRGGSWGRDFPCGVVAGACGGLAAAATAGCVMVLIDSVPRALLALTGATVASPLIGTGIWILLALTCWAALGGLAGITLGLLGQRGLRLLRAAATPLAVLSRLLGAGRLADLLALRP